jgi:hypothetical protein
MYQDRNQCQGMGGRREEHEMTGNAFGISF